MKEVTSQDYPYTTPRLPEEEAAMEEKVSFLSDVLKTAKETSHLDMICHLVQDDGLVSRIHGEELPPDEYYDGLRRALKARFPKASSEMIEHTIPMIAAFDTAIAFALSFGIAKFQLARKEAELVGVCRRVGPTPEPRHYPGHIQLASGEGPEGSSVLSRNSELCAAPRWAGVFPDSASVAHSPQACG